MRPDPFALPLDEFLAQELEPTPPLLGTERDTIVPTGGLVILAGRAGIGKTTLGLDGAFHFASGVDWLGVPVPGFLNVLLVENEGPIGQFQRKLAHKHERWPHELFGRIHVQTWRWGSFSFADDEAHAQACEFLEANDIDVVIGDPLGTLGVDGVGSPEDTRRFVRALIGLGLFGRRTFLFLHHFRKGDPTSDEIDQLSGAWGGHLDALLVMKATARPDEVRLSFPKLRWAFDQPKPLILGRVRENASFERLGEEGDPRLLESEIAELLADGRMRTAQEIASGKEGGIGARRADVETALEGNLHLFYSVNGKELGRSPKATCWGLLHNPSQNGGRVRDESDESRPGQRDLLVPPPVYKDRRDEWTSTGAATRPEEEEP